MKYPAPDGHIIDSNPNGPVIYTLPCDWMSEGIYESHETTSAATAIGIKQIKIVRVVENGTMIITVTESTEQELIDYKNSLV
jgi:hypothetical protein